MCLDLQMEFGSKLLVGGLSEALSVSLLCNSAAFKLEPCFCWGSWVTATRHFGLRIPPQDFCCRRVNQHQNRVFEI